MYELSGLWLIPFITLVIGWLALYVEDYKNENASLSTLEDVSESEN